ncbi:MAG: sulfotransferase family protein [Paracoccaceae bacterium]
MTIGIFGAGIGRTGTHALRTALNQLGLGPCHHMEEVLHDLQRQVPLWQAAVDGRPDWAAIYKGYGSAVDWPTATFFRELHVAYPTAKFVLTTRSVQTWADSFSETIWKALSGRAQAPDAMQPWLKMSAGVIAKAGFVEGMGRDDLIAAFEAHVAAVKAAIPANQLLEFRVADGWGPLCDFLGVPVPDGAFPRTNDRAEFWERIAGKR